VDTNLKKKQQEEGRVRNPGQLNAGLRQRRRGRKSRTGGKSCRDISKIRSLSEKPYTEEEGVKNIGKAPG